MTIRIDRNNNIYIRQGDTGNVKFTNIPLDPNQEGHFSLYRDGFIVKEWTVTVGTGKDYVVFPLSASETDGLEVGKYRYFFKISLPNGTEDTYIPEFNKPENRCSATDNKYMFYVGEKGVEGA